MPLLTPGVECFLNARRCIFEHIVIEEGRDLWVCSDFHLGHDRDFIWKARGFSDCAEHDRWILDNLRRHLTDYFLSHPERRLIIIHLGDLSLYDDGGVYAKEFLDLQGMNPHLQVYTMKGNHSASIDQLPEEYAPQLLPLMVSMQVLAEKKGRAGIKQILLCHYPLLEWVGAVGMLCGHCHGNRDVLNLPDERQPNTYRMGKILDCGVDNALKYTGRRRCFFTIAEVQKIWQKKMELFSKLPINEDSKSLTI